MKRNIFLMAAVAVSIMLLGSCNSEVADDANASVAKIDTTHCTTFVIKETPTTRVSITGHVPNGGAVVNWIPDDKLWLRTPADARIGSMGNNLTGVSAWAKFYFPAGYNDATYQVNYLGHTTRTDGRHVTIHPSQWQGVPNNTDHLQYVGDCAEGVAYRDANKAGIYNLTLHHLPAYLCILPYCNNEVIRPGAKVTKIVVRSDNAITGTFDVAASKFAAGTNLGTQIENALNGGNGFSLENNVPNQALNAAYFVIMPGVHTLSIDYYYTTPQMFFPMKITKQVPTRNYLANTMTDIYANINMLSFSPKFYLWDAAEGQDLFVNRNQYDGAPADLPANNTDSRWYNESPIWAAQRSTNIAPNVNQMFWYLANSVIDKDTPWMVDGKTGKGGLWIKKLSVIAQEHGVSIGDLANNYEGIDRRDWWKFEDMVSSHFAAGSNIFRSPTLSPTNPIDVSKYIFLPTISATFIGGIYRLRTDDGRYWSSSRQVITGFGPDQYRTEAYYFGFDTQSTPALVNHRNIFFGRANMQTPMQIFKAE